MRTSFVTALLSACPLLAGVAFAQPSQNFPKVTIAGSAVRTMKAAATGRQMDIYLHLPTDYDREKTKTYPAIYILDGQWDFKLMDSVLGGLVYDKFAPEMILVGITYAGENPDYNALRAMDLTPVADTHEKGSGDGPRFLKFLKTELIPFIESNYRADPKRRVLQGSSYAGLFTLYALFSDPGLFSGYMAGSPAVPFGDRYVFRQEAEFAEAHKELPVKLYLAVGSAEGLSAPVREFMQVLRSRNYKGLKLETRVIEGERHAGNKPELFNRGLRFLFADGIAESR
ncbi:MAG TPA: alpha/beta hydrolase-fold protein [Verrucomicrobiae bacterium]|nr:alpha/beta hydrolase-fold protein [Verrucomicrobiae bacterium]